MSAIKLSDGAVTRNSNNGPIFNDTVSNNGDTFTESFGNVWIFDAATTSYKRLGF